LYVAYHDREWGVPVHDDHKLFEMLVLEGAQAGLSWITILRKRENYRKALQGFDPGHIAGYGRQDVERLMQDTGLVRNRLKLESVVRNARAFLEVQARHGSFGAFLWDYVDGHPVQNCWRRHDEVPARTPVSDRLAKDLKALGFGFVGSTICYAYMQAVGMVNDHTVDCFRHPELNEPSRTRGGQ